MDSYIALHFSRDQQYLVSLPHVFAEVGTFDRSQPGAAIKLDEAPTFIRFKEKGVYTSIKADSEASQTVAYAAISREQAERFRAFAELMTQLKTAHGGEYFPFYYSSESLVDDNRDSSWTKPRIWAMESKLSDDDREAIINDPDPFVPLNCQAFVVLACHVAGIDLNALLPGHLIEMNPSDTNATYNITTMGDHYKPSESSADGNYHIALNQNGAVPHVRISTPSAQGPTQALAAMTGSMAAMSHLASGGSADMKPNPVPEYITTMAKAAGVKIPGKLQ